MTKIFLECLDGITTAPSNGKNNAYCIEYVRSGGTLFDSLVCENWALTLYFKESPLSKQCPPL